MVSCFVLAINFILNSEEIHLKSEMWLTIFVTMGFVAAEFYSLCPQCRMITIGFVMSTV